MKFKIEIDCGNDAFHGDGIEAEVVRILETMRYELTNGDADTNRRLFLHDINGNSVGTARFEGKRP